MTLVLYVLEASQQFFGGIPECAVAAPAVDSVKIWTWAEIKRYLKKKVGPL